MSRPGQGREQEPLGEASSNRESTEHHRHKGLSPTTNRYLKRILYANGTPYVAGDWLFELVFDYGEHDAVAPTPTDDSPWLVRQDPFSSYKATFEMRTYRLCRRVLMFHRAEELAEESEPVLVCGGSGSAPGAPGAPRGTDEQLGSERSDPAFPHGPVSPPITPLPVRRARLTRRATDRRGLSWKC